MSKETVEINLGIDFGTLFSKISYRDVGTEKSSIVSFDAENLNEAMIPSAISIKPNGKLQIYNSSGKQSTKVVDFLKMRLAGAKIGESLSKFKDIEIGKSLTICAVSSWYIASIIERSKKWITETERDLFQNRIPVWSANVGVPVDYWESGKIKRFESVFKVAWTWAEKGVIPSTLEDAIKLYEKNSRTLKHKKLNIHPIAEISAAIQSFISSREAEHGIYVYFDIGGGTVDGVTFRFFESEGQKRVSFYSGKVENIGTVILAEDVCKTEIDLDSDQIDLDQMISDAQTSTRDNFADKIHQQVGCVIVGGKRTDGTDWERRNFQGPSLFQSLQLPLPTSRMHPLVVFIGGGGANIQWYKDEIVQTHELFQHQQSKIPVYELVEVRKPRDYEMGSIAKEHFGRFAVSYGLTIPEGEGPCTKLPSQVPSFEPEPPKISEVVNFMDTKDAYD